VHRHGHVQSYSHSAFPGLGIKESAILYVWIGAILGLPIALFFGWRYDIIGGRIVRTAVSDVDADLSIGRTDYVILAVLSVVVVVTAFGLISQISDTRVPETTQFALADVHPKSIAVLPFVNMSSDPDNEYFADGISEQILDLLTTIPELQVTSRSSAFSFKGQNVDIPTIAARLNVRHVLEGSVRKSGDDIRITAQLIESDSDTHLWSATYDRKFENIFDIQDEIAASIVQALTVPLLDAPRTIAATDPKVFTLVLKADYLARTKQTEEGFWQVVSLLERALDIDPEYAPGWTRLGQRYLFGANIGLLSFTEGNSIARDAFQRAIDLDSTYAEGYRGMAEIAWLYDWDLDAAAEYIQRGMALEPGNADNLNFAYGFARTLGRVDEAIALERRAYAVNPMDAVGHQIRVGQVLYEARRFEEAAQAFQSAISLGNPFAHGWLAQVFLAQGDPASALEIVQSVDSTGNPLSIVALALIQHELGDDGASDVTLDQFIRDWGHIAQYQIAQIHAYRGDTDDAFEALERAYEVRDNGTRYLLLDPLLEGLHDDPRWPAFLDKMGLPH